MTSAPLFYSHITLAKLVIFTHIGHRIECKAHNVAYYYLYTVVISVAYYSLYTVVIIMTYYSLYTVVIIMTYCSLYTVVIIMTYYYLYTVVIIMTYYSLYTVEIIVAYYNLYTVGIRLFGRKYKTRNSCVIDCCTPMPEIPPPPPPAPLFVCTVLCFPGVLPT